MKLTIQIEIDTRNNPDLIQKIKKCIDSNAIDNYLEFAFARALKLDLMKVSTRGVEIDEEDNYIAETYRQHFR